MKLNRLLLSAFIAIIASSLFQALAGDTYVVAAGVSAYVKAPKLNICDRDANEFAKTMKKAGCHVSLFTSSNATHDNIIYAIRRIAKRANPDDRLVFYFSGHGTEGSLVAYDGSKKFLIPYTELIKEISAVNAGQKVAFIDACFSGTVTTALNSDSDWQSDAKNKNVILFMSSDAKEASLVSNFAGNSFFTRSVLNCLQGLCDKNRDKKITVEEMFEYISGDVRRRSKGEQNPILISTPDNLNAVFMKWR